MKYSYRFILSLVFTFTLNITNAQFYSHSLKIDVSIPKNISNDAFRISFHGVYDVNAAYYFYIAKGFNIGVGGKMTYAQIDWRKFPTLRSCDYSLYSAFGSLLYHYNVTPKQKFYAGIDAGLGWNVINKLGFDTLTTLYNKTALVIQPKMGYQFFVDENVAITVNLSYTNYHSAFNPDVTRLSKIEPFNGSQKSGFTNFINFGVGLNVGFKGKRFKKTEFPHYDTDDIPDNVPE